MLYMLDDALYSIIIGPTPPSNGQCSHYVEVKNLIFQCSDVLFGNVANSGDHPNFLDCLPNIGSGCCQERNFDILEMFLSKK